MHALLALEDGRLFCGRSFGDHTDVGAEVVFVTAMTGYQEILSDPSYHGQIVVFTSPHVGNYGIHLGHDESTRPWAAGLIVRDLCESPTPPAAVESLQRYVRRHRLCGMTDVDTRSLTLHLRRNGVLRGYFSMRVEDPEDAIARARAVPAMADRHLVAEVTAQHGRDLGNRPEHMRPRVAVLDFGVKQSILTELGRHGSAVTVLPAHSDPAAIDALRPDGVVLSNGPGDPETLTPLLPTIRHCVDRYPTLAICLGHQLAGLAMGGRIKKLRFGHHGANHPVRDLRTNQVMITAQNHNYALDGERLPPGVELTHVNLNDGTVEGFIDPERRLWSYQFHPEGAPGPHDARAIFRDFVAALDRGGAVGAA